MQIFDKYMQNDSSAALMSLLSIRSQVNKDRLEKKVFKFQWTNLINKVKAFAKIQVQVEFANSI